MNLKSLTDHQLTDRLKNLVAEERRLTTEVLHHLREVDRRRLFALRGHPSLISYCIGDLKYSEAAAYRRIQSMKLLREIPEIEEKIQSGELTLTTVAQTASFFRQVSEKRPTSIEEKKEVLKSIENLSRRETEKVLLQREPDLASKPQEKQRQIANGDTQVSMILDKELMAQIEEIQNLSGQKMELKALIQNLVHKELVRLKTNKGILAKRSQTPLHPSQPGSSDQKQTQKSQQAAQAPSESRKSHPPKARPYIARALKYRLWQRSKGVCEFVDPLSGKRCGEKFGLQLEHVQPVARGGKSDISNLQLLCQSHNQLRAIRTFGTHHMRKYIPNL